MNNRNLIVFPSFSGETYFRIKNSKSFTERDLFIMTRSPEQCEAWDSIGKVLDIVESKGGVIVFDDMFDCHPKAIDPVFTRGGHKALDF